MKIAIFSAKRYDREFLDAANAAAGHELRYFEAPLDAVSVGLAAGYGAVCIFVNDTCDADVLATLHRSGTRLVALRCTGFNNVDLPAAARLGIQVVRVVDYYHIRWPSMPSRCCWRLTARFIVPTTEPAIPTLRLTD